MIAMNVFSLAPIYRILSIIKGLFGFLFRLILWRQRKTKKDDGLVENDRPIEIISVGDSGDHVSSFLGAKNNEVNMSGNNPLVDWNDWKDSSSQDIAEEPAKVEADFFQDMEPTLTRPRVLRVMKNEQIEQKPKLQSRLEATDNTPFEVESELGTWTESASGWDEEILDDLSGEAANILKEKRRAERQMRTVEQKKRKEELRAIRAERKLTSQLGVKLN